METEASGRGERKRESGGSGGWRKVAVGWGGGSSPSEGGRGEEGERAKKGELEKRRGKGSTGVLGRRWGWKGGRVEEGEVREG